MGNIFDCCLHEQNMNIEDEYLGYVSGYIQSPIIQYQQNSSNEEVISDASDNLQDINLEVVALYEVMPENRVVDCKANNIELSYQKQFYPNSIKISTYYYYLALEFFYCANLLIFSLVSTWIWSVILPFTEELASNILILVQAMLFSTTNLFSEHQSQILDYSLPPNASTELEAAYYNFENFFGTFG